MTGHQPFLHPVVVDGERVVWDCCGGSVRGGGGPGRGPQQAVWQCVSRWPPSPCQDSAQCGLLCGLCLVAGGGWLVLVRGGITYHTVGGDLLGGSPR